MHDVQDDDLSGWAQFELLGTAKPKVSMCKFPNDLLQCMLYITLHIMYIFIMYVLNR